MCNTLKLRIYPPSHSGEIVKDENANFRRLLAPNQYAIHSFIHSLVVCLFEKLFQFASPNSNRNGLSRIYFYGALVPFLFLLGNQFAKSPSSSMLRLQFRIQGSWPMRSLSTSSSRLSFFASRTHPARHHSAQRNHEFDLSSPLLL